MSLCTVTPYCILCNCIGANLELSPTISFVLFHVIRYTANCFFLLIILRAICWCSNQHTSTSRSAIDVVGCQPVQKAPLVSRSPALLYSVTKTVLPMRFGWRNSSSSSIYASIVTSRATFGL